eukprot:TRINITY_DN18441_c0_g1_i1.p1 TRINITY_DN18441_c0_g1~~TRINITY_DN18441_c0_g1_i1.p1  ORF type:complete len:129 (-),score=0.47 TRINITY_DN18441_c0_g1_i1:328-714(-)
MSRSSSATTALWLWLVAPETPPPDFFVPALMPPSDCVDLVRPDFPIGTLRVDLPGDCAPLSVCWAVAAALEGWRAAAVRRGGWMSLSPTEGVSSDRTVRVGFTTVHRTSRKMGLEMGAEGAAAPRMED